MPQNPLGRDATLCDSEKNRLTAKHSRLWFQRCFRLGIAIAAFFEVQSVTSERLKMVPTRSGRPNVEMEGVAYHSPYDPVREARLFYAGLPLEEADVILHFGWGLGYSGVHLSQRLKADAQVFVFEPDAEVFELCRAERTTNTVLEDSRFHYIVGHRVSQFIDEWGLDGCQDTDRILWVGWPQAERLYRDVCRSVRQSFSTRLRDRAGNLLTHFENGRTYFENAVANLKYVADPTVGTLFGRFRGVPLVLVSAGPSLDRNIRYLRGLEERCFILAVDTALRPLLTAGVVPHAVIIADPGELNARHIVGAMPVDTYLIAEQAVHPAAMASARHRFQFSVGVFPDGLYREFGLERIKLDVWGSVATAALDLACRMGSDPIIFAGQDFSFSWGRDYASHTVFHGEIFNMEAQDRFETDVWGRDVPTTENLVVYRDFFVRRMSEASGTRFINATEGGILTGGVDLLSLRDALHIYARTRVDVRGKLGALHVATPDRSALASHICEVLVRKDANCGCIEGFLDLVAKKAVLENDRPAIEDSLKWGARLTEAAHAAIPE